MCRCAFSAVSPPTLNGTFIRLHFITIAKAAATSVVSKSKIWLRKSSCLVLLPSP